VKHITARIATAVAAGALVLSGAGVAGASVHPNATTECGTLCLDIHVYGNEVGTGQTVILAAKAPQATLLGAPSGTPVISRTASSSAWREDFITANVGTVKYLRKAGLLQAGTYVDLNYWNSEAFQIQYSPDSRTTNECVGTKGNAVIGGGVVLEPCGKADTLWVTDSNAPGTFTGGHQALLPATGQDSSNPLALQAPGAVGGQLKVSQEAFSSGALLDAYGIYASPSPAA